MTELESRINKILGNLAPTSTIGSALSGIKKTLNSSSQIVDAVNNLGDSLHEQIDENVGGIIGSVGGWMAGKSTKLVGGLAGGLVAGALKTVAGIIPDSSDIKHPETDTKIAHCIDTYTLPTDKDKLYELLQFVWTNSNSKSSPYGKLTLSSMKNLLSRVQATFKVAAKNDAELQELAKPYMPKKRFGIF
ncbi:MAG: hypothetical protein K2L14_03360 [Duncaniella sp.]|nr:hypothetical protein [Duncaniella sp.]